VTQRGALKRMLAQELPQLGRAKRGVKVLRDLKANPHRIVFMNESTELPLWIKTQKGTDVEVQPLDHPIGELKSNGSFVIDEKTEGGVLSVSVPITLDEESEEETKD